MEKKIKLDMRYLDPNLFSFFFFFFLMIMMMYVTGTSYGAERVKILDTTTNNFLKVNNQRSKRFILGNSFVSLCADL